MMQNEPKNQHDTTNLVDEGTPSDETPSFDADQTIVMTDTDFTDNVGDVSVEINVDELVAQVEAEHGDDVIRKQEIRRRLDQIAESQSFEETYAIEFEKD